MSNKIKETITSTEVIITILSLLHAYLCKKFENPHENFVFMEKLRLEESIQKKVKKLTIIIKC